MEGILYQGDYTWPILQPHVGLLKFLKSLFCVVTPKTVFVNRKRTHFNNETGPTY
jgi:hypothetical protein